MLLFWLWLFPALLTCLFVYLDWKLYTTDVYPRPALLAIASLGILFPCLGYVAPMTLFMPLFDCRPRYFRNEKIADWLFPDY